jgi:hypothetical protein
MTHCIGRTDLFEKAGDFAQSQYVMGPEHSQMAISSDGTVSDKDDKELDVEEEHRKLILEKYRI